MVVRITRTPPLAVVVQNTYVGNTIAVSLSSEELGENVGITVSGWGLTSDG